MTADELRTLLTSADAVLLAVALGLALTRRWGAACLAFVPLAVLSVALLASGTMG